MTDREIREALPPELMTLAEEVKALKLEVERLKLEVDLLKKKEQVRGWQPVKEYKKITGEA